MRFRSFISLLAILTAPGALLAETLFAAVQAVPNRNWMKVTTTDSTQAAGLVVIEGGASHGHRVGMLLDTPQIDAGLRLVAVSETQSVAVIVKDTVSISAGDTARLSISF